MRRLLCISVVVVALTVVASALGAGNSTLVSAYGGKAGTIAQVVKKSKPKVTHKVTPTKAVHTSTTLPFTGLDLVWVVLAAGVLVSLGVGLRRVAREDS